MIFVADEGVDRPIVIALRAAGHQVAWIAEQAPRMPDPEVLRLASDSDAVLITNDKDFGELVFRRRLHTRGVLLLRLAGLGNAAKATAVVAAVAAYDDQLTQAFTVVEPSAVRIRPARASRE